MFVYKTFLAVLCSMFLSSLAYSDIAIERNQRNILFSKAGDLLVRTTCPLDTLPLSIGTCAEEHAEVDQKAVYNLAAPKFGEKMAHFAERARLWVVEITRADTKILELLSVSPDPTQDLSTLKRDIDRLNSESTDIETSIYELVDQIKLLEAEYARNQDNDLLALLNTRRNEKRVLEVTRQTLLKSMEELRSRLVLAQSAILDRITFERVVEQRSIALKEYTKSLAQVTAEEDRRIGFERTLAYIADNGFTYRILAGSSENERLTREVADVLHKAFSEVLAVEQDIRVLSTQPQYVSCFGGRDAYCGIRTKFTVTVPSRLDEVSCRIVDAISPCFRMTIFKAEANEIYAVDGSIIAEEKDEVTWSHKITSAEAWSLPAEGKWIVLGRCEYPVPFDLRYPGRIACEVKLRGPAQ
jgi:hypothetical protein